MSKPSSVIAATPERGTLEDLIPRPMLFPDEDPGVYEDLRDALIGDLAPGRPYERTLAENLVTLEWEAIRHRRMRDALIKAKARDLAAAVFETGRLPQVVGYKYARKYEDLAFALVSADRDRSASAAETLKEHEIDLEEIYAVAYSRVAGQVELHEKKLAEIEARRRRLRDDYDRLKAARAKPVEDAEVVE